jgi:predicted nucleic acid-binding protein
LNLYAESSAVLSWLFGEDRGASVRRQLRQAEMVFASDLTLIECERVIIRARVLEEIPEKKAQFCRSRLLKASAQWHILRIGAAVVGRARLPFPAEPVRILDALHLATALVGQTAIPDLALLSLDTRIRSASQALGFVVLPK